MKKIIIGLLLILCFQAAKSQWTIPGYTYIAQRYVWLGGLFRALNIPAGDSAQFQTGQVVRAGAIYYDSTGVDSGLYVWSGLVWKKASEGGFFTPDQTSTGATSHDANGNDFGVNNIGDLVLAANNTNIIATSDLTIQGDSVRFNSTSGRIIIPNLDEVDDTTTYKPTVRDPVTGRFRQFTHWPGGGGGDDDSAYHRMEAIDDTTVVFHSNNAADTLVIAGQSTAYVDTIYRTPGEDSIRYTINGVEYAIKDSVGSGGGGVSDFGVIQAATYVLTSSTSLQKLFDAVANGEITVTANTTYEFECMFSLSSMSATSGNCGFDIIGAGTATATSAHWSAVGRDGGSLNTGTNSTGIFSASTAETGNIVAAATTTNMYAYIKGMIRINGGGTIIPSVNLTNAAAAVVGVDSYFKLKPIGDGSVTSW